MIETDMQQFEDYRDGVLVRAPAKLNLSLLIAGKRPDGFHEIETIMAKIDWCDEIHIQRAAGTGIDLVCEGPFQVPQDRTNLVYRAAEQIFAACDDAPPVRLTLIKNIPAGSGLGSGSSDAAATLAGLNAYLPCGLPQSRLMEMAARLGSDVPFFLNGPLALCTGRGEKICEIPRPFPFTALLILPNVNSSTKKVYDNYSHDATLYRQFHAQIAAQIEKNSIDSVAHLCANMLQRSCFHLYEELGELREAVESLGVGPVCLSGSGSTMFFLLDDADAGCPEKVRDQVAERTGCRCIIVRSNRW